MIGIVGGMGPHAGLILAHEVLKQNKVECDQDFIDLAIISLASKIPDRTVYLRDPQKEISPALGIVQSIEKLQQMGAYYIGLACNTSHATLIFDEVNQLLKQRKIEVKIVSIIQAVIDSIKELSVNCVGLMATRGTYLSGVYQEAFDNEPNLTLIQPNEQTQEELHQLIYHPNVGIKVKGNKIEPKVDKRLKEIWKELIHQGAKVCILGCTELSLQFWDEKDHPQLLDSKVALAKALISAVSEGR